MFARNTFIENPKLAKITLPNNLATIPASVFYKNSNLRTIHIPASVTEIAAGAFNSCSSLTSVYFEENSKIKHIIYDSFIHCTSLLHTGTYVYDAANSNAIKETSANDGFDMTTLKSGYFINVSFFI